MQAYLDRVRAQTNTFYTRYRTSHLLKSGSWYLISTFIQRGLSFFAVFLFTRLLTIEEYGTVSVFMLWVSIFSSTITLNVYASVTRAKYEFEEEQFNQFLSACVGLGTTMSLLTMVVIWALPETLIGAIFGLPRLLIMLAALTVSAEISIYSTLARWQSEYRYQAYSYLNMGLALGKLVIPVLLIIVPNMLFHENRALGRIIGMTSVSIVVGVYLLVQVMRRGRAFLRPDYWRYSLAYSIPLMPHMLSGLILAQIDRLLIDHNIGREAAGLYTLAYQIGELVTLIWTATNNAWVPWFYEQMQKTSYPIIRRRSNQYLVGFTALTVVSILIGPLLLKVFSPPQYWVTAKLVPVIMGGMFFNLTYAFYANVEFYEKKTSFISVGTALAAVVNVVLNLLWLPIFGYVASAWATLIAYVTLFLFHAGIVIFILRKPHIFNFWLMILFGGAIVVLTAVMYWLT